MLEYMKFINEYFVSYVFLILSTFVGRLSIIVSASLMSFLDCFSTHLHVFHHSEEVT